MQIPAFERNCFARFFKLFRDQKLYSPCTVTLHIFVEPPSLTVWSPRGFIYEQHITPASYNGDRFFQLFKPPTTVPVVSRSSISGTSCQLLQYRGTSCQLLQYRGTSCHLLQYSGTSCLLLQYSGTSCHLLQYSGTSCPLLQYSGTSCHLLQYSGTSCPLL